MAIPCRHMSRQDVPVTLTILRMADEVIGVVEAVTTAMNAVGYRDKDIFDLRLALEEAIVNAVKHGNRCDPGKQVQVRYSINEERVLAEVEDQGPGFKPAEVPDPTALENLERPCGRGLFLIRHYSTWVEHNETGNCIRLCKQPSVPLKLVGRM